MKQSETVKEYSDRLLGIVNKVRLLGTKFKDSRIVEKILVTVRERYEVSITTLENTKDLSKITLAELLNTLQAQEQRRLMRQDGMAEGALIANHKTQSKSDNSKKNYSPCQHCDKKVICKNKCPKYEADAQVANEEDEDHLFMATYFSTKKSDFWMIDSGCTNHMTYDRNILKEFMSIKNKKVRIENGDYIPTKGKGTIAIKIGSGTKIISDVLYVPDINQNLLSVNQLVEKGFKLLFDNKYSRIFDATKQEILRVKMRSQNVSFNPTKDEHIPENYKTKDELADLFTKSIPAKSRVCSSKTKEEC
ncbi:uncharacterized protein LOC132628423 [Lycium barbarum]|uniref:uncharacterized protein LOC132628423 n=1 Tax=Lycium barbarum TaxID=112863 RepID=UPI00293E4024|nr:uncharacterized protein LOC132628423 [Lycium barbarum]